MRPVMRWAVAALVGIVLAAGARPVAAQTAADTAAVLLEAARQLQQEGEAGAADALLQLLRRRYPGTPAAGEAARLLAQLRAAPEPTRSGRVELLVFGTTYGLWAGVAVPIVLDADSPEAVGAGLLLGGPAGFLATRAYLRGRALSEGQARAITFGGTWGTWQGFGWTQVLSKDEECFGGPDGEQCYEGDPSGEKLVAGALGGGLAGMLTGAVLARKPISSGVATAVSFGGLWGTWYGAAIGGIADLEDDDLLAATLAGGDAGLLAMALLAPRWNPSRARARLVSLGGVVGLLGGLGLDLLLIRDDTDEDLALLIPTVTSAVGLTLAARATRNFDSPPDGAPARRNGGGSDGTSGALLQYRNGRLDMDVPAVRLGVERRRSERATTSLYVPVLHARF